MNIKITHSMLLEYLETDASPEEIQEFVSLGGPNIETIEKVGEEYVYDIEVTSNRVDAASAFGMALECAAILPRYKKTARLKQNPLDSGLPSLDKNTLPLEIILTDESLASRIMAIVLSNVTVGKSPEHISQRLEACGERSINNVVDTSNYLRLMLGHPVHMFDYKKVKGAKMTIRLSKKMEAMTTLDNKETLLPGNDIIIEDAGGNIIDLAGIMGAANSGISESSTDIILFVPTFTGRYIRQTSMKTAQRTNAVAYFEKDVDPERAAATFAEGLKLLQQYAGGTPASVLTDIYSKKREHTKVTAQVDYINKVMATDLKPQEIQDLIRPLGFDSRIDGGSLVITVPSYRSQDVSGPSDIVEEVARIYGYHNIPGSVQIGEAIMQPLELQRLFTSQNTMRHYLRAQGFNEQYNYSMVSKKLLMTCNLDVAGHLHLLNTISEEIEYMRTSLIPSLLKNIADNKGLQDEYAFFECARVYLPREKELPDEQERLAIVTTKNFSYVVGIIENICAILKIKDLVFEPSSDLPFLVSEASATLRIGGTVVGYVGNVQRGVGAGLGVDMPVVVAEIYLPALLENIQTFTQYVEPSKFARVKLDLTYVSDQRHTYSEVVKNVYAASSHVLSTTVLSQFEHNVTLRIEFGFVDRNMTEEEAKKELEKIKVSVLK